MLELTKERKQDGRQEEGSYQKQGNTNSPLSLSLSEQIQVTSWNCRGFPWHKGEGLTEVLPQADILFLMETWKQQTCRIPYIEGYVTHSVHMSNTKMKGQGGVAVIYKEEL